MKKVLVVVVAVGLLAGGAGVAWAAAGDSSSGSGSGSAQLAAFTTAARPGQGARGGIARLAVQVAADTIHVDRATLVQELRSGKSIADVAREHNVDPQTVIDGLVKAATDKLQSLVTAGKVDADRAKKVEARLPQLAARLVNGKLRNAGRPGVRRAIVKGSLDVAADTIHIDRATLVRDLRTGKSIADVARAHNVDPQAVIDALVNAAKQKLSDLQSSGKLTEQRVQRIEQRLPTLVERLVNRKFDGRNRPASTASTAATAQPADLAA